MRSFFQQIGEVEEKSLPRSVCARVLQLLLSTMALLLITVALPKLVLALINKQFTSLHYQDFLKSSLKQNSIHSLPYYHF